MLLATLKLKNPFVKHRIRLLPTQFLTEWNSLTNFQGGKTLLTVNNKDVEIPLSALTLASSYRLDLVKSHLRVHRRFCLKLAHDALFCKSCSLVCPWHRKF